MRTIFVAYDDNNKPYGYAFDLVSAIGTKEHIERNKHIALHIIRHTLNNNEYRALKKVLDTD